MFPSKNAFKYETFSGSQRGLDTDVPVWPARLTIIGRTPSLPLPPTSSRYGMSQSKPPNGVQQLFPFLTAAYGRTAPISNLTFPTSTETITSVRFNLSEASILASVGSDRTFTLYDIRTGKAERRVIMQVGRQETIICSRILYPSPLDLDAKQLVGMVANVPNDNIAGIRRSQSVYV